MDTDTESLPDPFVVRYPPNEPNHKEVSQKISFRSQSQISTHITQPSVHRVSHDARDGTQINATGPEEGGRATKGRIREEMSVFKEW